MHEPLVDSILGCIIGGAIGDAAGAAHEGMLSIPLTEVWDATGWRLTDDTQLTLATCEAITETGTPDPKTIAASCLRWFRGGRLTGLGASTLKSLRDLDAGAHWALAGRRGDRAAGNGAAMRIAPLALCIDPQKDESKRLIRDVSRITHHSDEAYAGALAVVFAVFEGLQHGAESVLSLARVASNLPDTSVRDRLLTYAELAPGKTCSDVSSRYGVSGYVADSVPFALFGATQVSELGFTGLLQEIISAGGDTDTNASLAGQVVGAALGFRRLPAKQVERLPQSELVFRIAQDFAEAVAGRG